MGEANSITALAQQIILLADACDPPALRKSPCLDPRYPLRGTSGAAQMARREAREALRARDGDCCCHCGAVMIFPTKETGDVRSYPNFASIEHVDEARNGGSDDLDNLKLACLSCNKERDVIARMDAEADDRHSALHRLLNAYRRGNACKLSIDEVRAVVEEVFDLAPGKDPNHG